MIHYASINEMIALCLYMDDRVRHSRDILTAIETSLYSYARAAEEERFARYELLIYLLNVFVIFLTIHLQSTRWKKLEGKSKSTDWDCNI